MRRKWFSILLTFTLVWLVLTSSSWPGQVITQEVKLWAKKALQQEKTLKTTTAPNTLAVLYFHNQTGWSKLDLLQKGLTLMLITDLSKIKEINVLERVKMQALVEELGLGISGLVEAKSFPRVGRLLGAQHLVGGDIVKGKTEAFQLTSHLLKVPTERVFGQAMAAGKLPLELFRMEKDLAFEIIKLLKIELLPELRKELEKPLTTSTEALFHFLQGIKYGDWGDFDKAKESHVAALNEDPDFALAAEALEEIESLSLEEKKACKKDRNRLLRGLRRRLMR
jgi:TolB-like protein